MYDLYGQGVLKKASRSTVSIKKHQKEWDWKSNRWNLKKKKKERKEKKG